VTVIVGVGRGRARRCVANSHRPLPRPGRNFDVRRQFSSVPATEYRSVQAAAIPVDVDHARPIGTVRYLELSQGARLHAVCEIDGAGLEGPLYFSPSIRHVDG
jgi:hypothetical protein